MHNSSVDRPDPVAPTIAAASPRSSSRLTSRRTEFVATHEPAPAVKPLWRPITSSASVTPIDSAPRTRYRHRVAMAAIEIARAQGVILSEPFVAVAPRGKALRARNLRSLVRIVPRASPASRTKGLGDLRIVCDDADRPESDHDAMRHASFFDRTSSGCCGDRGITRSLH